MPTAPWGQVGEFAILASREGKPAVRASELVALVLCGLPNSRYTPVTELVMLVSRQKANVMTQVSELVMLTSYVSGGTERFNSRAWGFNFDQHQFYVMHLGEQGTLVFDVLSSQWAQFQTQGFSTWNAENGIEWNGEIYFGDSTLPTLWRIDPDSFLDDDFRPVLRVVTGGIPAEARQTLRTGMFVLSATKQSEIDEDAYLQLSISDDGGFTYKTREALELDASETQDFSWRGLGAIKAPGRVFKIEDQGAVVTIKGANQKLAGEK